MNHSEAINVALLTLSELGCLAARRDVGLFRDHRGNPRRIGITGEADIQGTMPGGRSIAVEVKTGNATQTADQKRWQAAFEARGGLFVLARFNARVDGAETIRHAVLKATGEVAA